MRTPFKKCVQLKKRLEEFSPSSLFVDILFCLITQYYFFLVNNDLIFAPIFLKKFPIARQAVFIPLPIAVKPFFKATPKSANVFFLTANQKIANPPIPEFVAQFPLSGKDHIVVSSNLNLSGVSLITIAPFFFAHYTSAIFICL